MQYSLGKESSRDFQTCESGLIVACLTIASGKFPKRSSHLIMFHWVPHALLNPMVWAFLATKSFAAGYSTYPCQLACVSKSVPRDVISSIHCSTQLPRSAVGVMSLSRGWLLSSLIWRSAWSSGFLRLVLMPPCQSGVSLKRHLKVLIAELLKRNKQTFLVSLLVCFLPGSPTEYHSDHLQHM